ncbi:MbnP family protein [Algoriphagus sp. SE2]|uniref:MbnP family protein n=1 Tax=Algoriphagus sp. SE2 TaxID=3141536 RepID=UPI0031CD1A09
MKNLIYTALFSSLLLFSSCNEDEVPATMAVDISLDHIISGQPLELNGKSFTLPSGESFTPKKFKYYISNVKLTNSKTGEIYVESDSYHLISEDGNKSIDLGMIPTSNYDQITFSIGVDEIANGKTDQTGDLDPNSDMAWNWNTGYKFLILEGEFTNAKTEERQGLVMHIGTNANYKTITQSVNGLKAGKATTISLVTNLDELFVDPNSLLLSELESTTIMFGEMADKVAENYSEGFITIK